MRKYSGYTHFSFIYGHDGNLFYSSTFFELMGMLHREIKEEEKQIKKSQQQNKGGRKKR